MRILIFSKIMLLLKNLELSKNTLIFQKTKKNNKTVWLQPNFLLVPRKEAFNKIKFILN